jgi:hypothetical protein
MKNLKWEIKSRECGGFFFPSFFWGAGYLQSMLNSSASMVLDSGSSVRPFASSSFSAQSGTQPFVHHGGEILQQEDAIQKAFSVLNGPGLTTTMLWCFFFPLFWNQVLHGGRSAKLSSTYKVAYVWCLNLCEISLSLCVSAGNLQGLHNIQGNYSMQSVQNALPSRNQGMAGGLSTGTHQPTGGRFSSNNLPVGLPQVSAHSSLKRKFSFPPPCSLIILPSVISVLIQ